MRRSALVLVSAIIGLTACGSARDRELARYYDPQGLFSARLPAANTLSVAPAQPGQGGPSLLTGVISQPPSPSPSPQGQFGGGIGAGIGQATTPTDQTVYEAFVVTTDAFEDVSDMAVYYLTGDPALDLREERSLDLAGTPGRLIVADAVRDGEVTAGIAAAVSLGVDGTGYLVAAIFPPGEWDSEEPDFLRVVRSFRSDQPPVLRTYPLTEQVA